MSGLLKLQEEVRNKILRLRAIATLIEKQSFIRVWEDSHIHERQKAIGYIEKFDKDSLHIWMRYHPSLEIAERPLSILKIEAQKLKIPGYSRLTKLETIHALEQYYARKNKKADKRNERPDGGSRLQIKFP